MKGMISIKLSDLHSTEVLDPTSKITLHKWKMGLITWLLEATHGQWIYHNLAVHDRVSGFLITHEKEHLLREIETQIDKGAEGLGEQDQWMLDLNLNNIEQSSGEQETYWLIAIKASRERHHIQMCTGIYKYNIWREKPQSVASLMPRLYNPGRREQLSCSSNCNAQL